MEVNKVRGASDDEKCRLRVGFEGMNRLEMFHYAPLVQHAVQYTNLYPCSEENAVGVRMKFACTR